jgi:DNA primase
MDISEQVLISTLAQLVQKDVVEVGKKQKQEQKAFEVVKNELNVQEAKVDVLYRLERKIIEILLLYGNKTEEFEDVLLRSNEEGEIKDFVEKKEYKISQKVYLNLQEDESEFVNPLFRDIYSDLINLYLQDEPFSLENYLMSLQPEFAQEVTDILMEDEKYVLDNWEGQNIFPKTKEETLIQHVSDTLLTLRWFLISQIIEDLKNTVSNEPDSDNTESLSIAMNYIELRTKFSKKMGRVVVRYH